MKNKIIIALLVLIPAFTWAQKPATDTLPTEKTTSDKSWAFSASAYYYLFPDDDDVFSFIGSADHGSLHLEPRYNYEDTKTGSLFAGWKFAGGKNFEYSFTPMVGFVFGNTDGVAPGLKIELAWNILDFYSESEYVFDFESKENNFAYTWSEIGVTPFENFRTGITIQRTRLFETKLDVQRGVMASYTFKNATLGAHYFNPFSSSWFLVAVLSYEF